ncbi:MAG: lipoprotein [Alphaproteobacteria bacterium]
MKKVVLLFFALFVVAGCCHCETEPLVQENHKLIVPNNFGNMPK